MTNNDDLQRDMGRVEAGLTALERAMSEGFKDIKEELRAIKLDVESLKASESHRKGAFSLGQWLVGGIGAICALILQHFWK